MIEKINQKSLAIFSQVEYNLVIDSGNENTREENGNEEKLQKNNKCGSVVEKQQAADCCKSATVVK